MQAILANRDKCIVTIFQNRLSIVIIVTTCVFSD